MHRRYFMKKHVYMILLLLVFIVFPKYIYADCTKEELKYFKGIKDEFSFEMFFDSESKVYYPFFHNPEPEKYGFLIEYREDGETLTYDLTAMDNQIFSFPEISPGKYKIRIVGKTDMCSDALKTLSMTVPKYNIYSEDEACKGIEDFVLCQPSYSREIDYETFLSRVENYKKNYSQTQIEQEEEKSDFELFIENVKNYVLDNLVTIIVVTVFAILLIITIILTVKQARKSRRLE